MTSYKFEKISYSPIGVIHTPFTEVSGMPIQPGGALGLSGIVEVFPEYAPGLVDLDGFSHVILIYDFHRVEESRLSVKPFLDNQNRGIFATRAPKRPNPIGLSVVHLLSIDGNELLIENVDILDGTPLLDIKPSIPEFDHVEVSSLGWYAQHIGKVSSVRSDKRFED
jgi:tRNA-Thr(GGU) m(6)t(6)A37 methyltransferase TsaA